MAITIGISGLVCHSVLIILFDELQIDELVIVGDLPGDLFHRGWFALRLHLLFRSLNHHRLDRLFFRVCRFLLRWGLAMFLLGRIWWCTIDLDNVFRFLDFMRWCRQVFRQNFLAFLMISSIGFGGCLFCCSLSPGTRHWIGNIENEFFESNLKSVDGLKKFLGGDMRVKYLN